MPFGQIVIGPPGSGKTVYCNGMQQFLNGLKRRVCVVNLDPANDNLPYDCSINIFDLITLDDVIEAEKLGPNGGLIYALEFLEKNLNWLKGKLDGFKDHYFVFDCPGQVELYTHHNSVRNIVQQLQKWDFRVTSVMLVDSLVCTQITNYISAVLLSLTTMLQLELPHVNVLSKIDVLRNTQLDYNLDFYTEVQDPSRLIQYLNRDRFSKKFRKLNEAICELAQDFSLVHFFTLDIQDKDSVTKLVQFIDKSNGYIFGGLTEGNDSIMTVNATEKDWEYNKYMDTQDKYEINPEADDEEMEMDNPNLSEILSDVVREFNVEGAGDVEIDEDEDYLSE